MGKDSSKAKESSKGKGKQAGGGGDDNASSKGKGKAGKSADGLGTCTYVKGILLFLLSISHRAYFSMQSA